jgi:nucleoside phosphorylase
MKTILFIAALQEELDSLWEDKSFDWSDPKYQGDAIWYREANVDGFHLIAATACEMGLVASGIVTTKLILSWRPEIIFDFGLCAGRADMVEMETCRRTNRHPYLRGDVVVSTACFLYGAGFHSNGNVRQFESKCATKREGINFVQQAEAKWVSTWNIVPKPDKCADEPAPQIIRGEYAAADYLMRNDKVMMNLARKHKNFRALEMESYAVAKSAEILGVPFGAVIVKAILDNGTPAKNDEKRVLAITASRVFAVTLAKEFITATKGRKSGWLKSALSTLAFPQKKVLLLSSANETSKMLSQELKTSLSRKWLGKLVPVHTCNKKSLVLAETSRNRPCGQADFAIWATLFISKCKPRLVLVAGLCPGIPKREKSKKGKRENIKSCTGDLILVNRAYHHQFGALVKGKSLEREIRSVDLNDSLHGFLHSIHAGVISKWFKHFSDAFVKQYPRARKPKGAPKCHIAPAASSDYLLNDNYYRDHISEFDRKVKGVDIEAYAVMRAAQHCDVTLGALLVRGISRHLNLNEGVNCPTFSRALSAHLLVKLLNHKDLKSLL